MMDRRDLLKMIMATTGVALVGGNALAYEMTSQVPLSNTIFTPDDVILFNEIAEVILPRTDTPGAKDANVGLMALILANDCYTKRERDTLVKGLKSLNEQSQKDYSSPYLLLNAQQKTVFITQLDIDAKAYNNKQDIHYLSVTPYDRNSKDDKPLPHYFTLIKQLTLFSFSPQKKGQQKCYDTKPFRENIMATYPIKKATKHGFNE